jgi:hypothetical protein
VADESDSPRRRRLGRAQDVVAGVVGFLVPAIAVYVILRHVWPIQHDLSDIGTGLMRLLASGLAGLVGLVVAALVIRALDRRRGSPGHH